MNILMATSESLPFSKTGGLADVIFSLSKEFVKLKNNVSIVLPKYKTNKVIKYGSYTVKLKDEKGNEIKTKTNVTSGISTINEEIKEFKNKYNL